MKEPSLIIMAAGMGSRYGGLKQIDPVGSGGELIMDFSIYDAWMAGFKKVVFVIKREFEKDFKKLIDNRAGRFLEVGYAFQELTDLPKGYSIPDGREKPWGTCHAVLSCKALIDGPFAVINADDYYGAGAFGIMYDFLSAEKKDDDHMQRHAMVGYKLENTLTENGHVARGVCETTGDGYLKSIVERTKIMHRNGGIAYCLETADGRELWTDVPFRTTVSMNFWGFEENMMKELEDGFPKFLDKALLENPLKGEYFLPLAVDRLLAEKRGTIRVLNSADKWYGVTYKEDKEGVMDALQAMKDKGLYPEVLWK